MHVHVSTHPPTHTHTPFTDEKTKAERGRARSLAAAGYIVKLTF